MKTEVWKLEIEYAQAKLSMSGGRELMTSPGGLVWLQLGKTLAELRAMTSVLKIATAGAKVKGLGV